MQRRFYLPFRLAVLLIRFVLHGLRVRLRVLRDAWWALLLFAFGFSVLFAGLMMTILIGCANPKDQAELKRFRDEQALTSERLVRFDSLDFDVYSNQKWDSFSVSHDANIKVYYPDGSITVGLEPSTSMPSSRCLSSHLIQRSMHTP